MQTLVTPAWVHRLAPTPVQPAGDRWDTREQNPFLAGRMDEFGLMFDASMLEQRTRPDVPSHALMLVRMASAEDVAMSEVLYRLHICDDYEERGGRCEACWLVTK